jgi:uncharacterized protein YxjI
MPTVVVDARYCAPHAKKFEVTRMLWNDFAVRDASGAAVMQIVPAGFSFLHSYHLVDVSASSRRRVLTVKRSLSLFGRSWVAYSGNGTGRSSLLFDANERPSLFTRADIHVHVAGGGDGESHHNFIVATGLFGHEYTVSRGGSGGGAVAQIIRRWGFFGQYYDVSVHAGVDHAFVLALTAILEDMRKDDDRRKRT